MAYHVAVGHCRGNLRHVRDRGVNAPLVWKKRTPTRRMPSDLQKRPNRTMLESSETAKVGLLVTTRE